MVRYLVLYHKPEDIEAFERALPRRAHSTREEAGWCSTLHE